MHNSIKITRIIISIMLIFTLVTGVYSVAFSAAPWPDNVDTVSSAAIVMDVESGAIIYEKNIDTKYYPASITKVLTALIAIENSNLNEVVTFSRDAVFKNGGDTSNIGRDAGEQMTMEQCLYAMMLESCNESAYAIAEHVGGGDINKFLQMMNDTAKSLGCTNSHFNNPNGLPDTNHYVTAKDMALISRAAYQNKVFAKITGTKQYTIPPTNKHADSTILNNHHAMLNYYQTNRYLYEPCVGGKTGYTNDAGATLVTYAKKNNMTLVSVTLHGDTQTYYTDNINMLNYCFDNFKVYNLSDTNVSISDNLSDKIGVLSNDSKYIRRGEHSNVILPLSADIKDTTTKLVPQNTQEATSKVEYYYGDRFVGAVDIYYDKADTMPYPFHNIDKESGGSDITYIRIDFVLIIIIIAVVLALFIIYRFMRYRSGKILLKAKRRRDNSINRRSVGRRSSKYTTIDRRRKKRRRRRRY